MSWCLNSNYVDIQYFSIALHAWFNRPLLLTEQILYIFIVPPQIVFVVSFITDLSTNLTLTWLSLWPCVSSFGAGQLWSSQLTPRGLDSKGMTGPVWGPPGSRQPPVGPLLAYEPCYLFRQHKNHVRNYGWKWNSFIRAHFLSIAEQGLSQWEQILHPCM